MQRRDEQGQRDKDEEEEEDGDKLMFLAFTAPSHKHEEDIPKPAVS